jgi:hypothetical protein
MSNVTQQEYCFESFLNVSLVMILLADCNVMFVPLCKNSHGQKRILLLNDHVSESSTILLLDSYAIPVELACPPDSNGTSCTCIEIFWHRPTGSLLLIMVP